MTSVNPAVTQWIQQLADPGQAVAFYAYQSLQAEVFSTSRAGQEAAQATLAAQIGDALIAQAKAGQGGGAAAASVRENVFLAAAATDTGAPLYPPQVRAKLARLLGYLPHASTVPYLAKALDDFDAREMARQSLERSACAQATAALVRALNSPGPEFCVGVLHSLAARRDPESAAAVRAATADPQPEVRVAALLALAEFPDPAGDALLEKAAKSPLASERQAAHVARVRLAATLRGAGNRPASDRIYRGILAGDAPEAQKRACHIALAST